MMPNGVDLSFYDEQGKARHEQSDDRVLLCPVNRAAFQSSCAHEYQTSNSAENDC